MLNVLIGDKRFYELIDVSQEMIHLGNFGGVTEGFLWSEINQDLMFNTLTNQKTWKGTAIEGFIEIDEHTDIRNGMAYDNEGRIVACVQIGYCVARMNRDLTNYQVIASEYNSHPLNSPNDIVVRSDGAIYFTDPVFGRRPTRHGRFDRRTQPLQGVYRIDPETLEVILATGELFTPNGLCFSSDERKIYFADSAVSQIVEMDVMPDGTFAYKKVLASTLGRGEYGLPDGIKIDEQGNIWCSAEGGIQVFTPEGIFLGMIRTKGASGNLCFGGKDLQTIFIGSEFDVYMVQALVRGNKLRD